MKKLAILIVAAMAAFTVSAQAPKTTCNHNGVKCEAPQAKKCEKAVKNVQCNGNATQCAAANHHECKDASARGCNKAKCKTCKACAKNQKDCYKTECKNCKVHCKHPKKKK